MPGQDAGQQAGRIAPDVVVRIVLDELEAAERERTAIGIAEEQPVEHASAARAGGGREQRELAVLGLEAATELREVDRAEEPRAAQGTALEALEVVDLDIEPRRAAAMGAAAGDQPGVVVAHVEREPAPHALAEVQIRSGGGARHGSCPAIPSATRSAKAAIVKLGFTPTGPGIAAPSAT